LFSWRRLVSQSTASSTPCYCKAVAQQRAKFKPTHAAGPRPVMTSRRKQDRPRRVGVDRHRFRHKKGDEQSFQPGWLTSWLADACIGVLFFFIHWDFKILPIICNSSSISSSSSSK
ncbi:hypothetical protein T10_2761, partial [Trichinella papuae]